MLKNKPRAFFVTGSSSGIGRAIADEIRSFGANVIYHGKTDRTLEVPSKCEFVHGDLSSDSVAESLSAYLLGKYEIEGVICCAGRTHLSNLEDTPLLVKKDEMYKVFDNILACTVTACQKFTSQMIAKKAGKIIIIGGDVVDRPNEKAEMCAYAVAKAAVHQYALYLANSLRPHNVSVNVVAPTGVFRNENPPDLEKTLQRRAAKEEIAKTVSFLCAGQSFLSGQIIRINGGRTNYFNP